MLIQSKHHVNSGFIKKPAFVGKRASEIAICDDFLIKKDFPLPTSNKSHNFTKVYTLFLLGVKSYYKALPCRALPRLALPCRALPSRAMYKKSPASVRLTGQQN